MAIKLQKLITRHLLTLILVKVNEFGVSYKPEGKYFGTKGLFMPPPPVKSTIFLPQVMGIFAHALPLSTILYEIMF